MAIGDELNKGKNAAKQTTKEVEFLIDAFSSLGATIQNTIAGAIDEMNGLDTVSKKVAKTFERDIVNSVKKLVTSLDQTTILQEKVNSSSNASLAIEKERNKQQVAYDSLLRRVSILKKVGIKIDKETLKEIATQKELSDAILDDLEKQNEAREKAGGVTTSALKGIDGLLNKAGFGNLAKKLNFKGAIDGATTLHEFTDGTYKATINTSQAFKNVAKNIKGAVSAGDLLATAALALAKASKQADKNIANLRRDFGLSFNESRKLNDQFAGIAIRSGDVTANVESLTKANQNINDQLGIQTTYNEELLVVANALVKRNKLSAEAAAGFAQQVLATGVSAKDLENISAQTVAQIQNQTGVQLSFNSVLEGANKISGQLRVNLARTPDGLVKAVATAKTLGVEMGSIASIAGQLLDFESSITKELEAELLLGRDLNLEQARLLALNGKSDEAVASLVSQVGTLAEFQKLNVIQQEGLAGAIGMTADQLATIVEKQAAINSQKKEGLNIDAESMKEGASALSIQEKLASAVEKLNSILQATAVFVGVIVGALAFALSPFTGGLSLAAFLGAGGLAGAALTGMTPMAAGGMVTGPTNAVIGEAGPEAVIPLNDNTPLIKQANETNKLLKEILTKQGTVNIDSTRAGTAFAMGTYQIQ